VKGKALIIGGSLGGLFAGNCLRKIGWQVEIFEKTGDDLASRGAGLGTHDEIFAVMEHLGIEVDESIGVSITRRYNLNRKGLFDYSIPVLQRQSSWAWFYHALRRIFPDSDYHVERALVRVEQLQQGVRAHFDDGSCAEADLLIGADGIRSTVRAQFAPQAQPQFAGYVGWRGILKEADFPRPLHKEVFEKYIFGIPDGQMFLGYPVPGVNGDLRLGHRGYNFVWYHPIGDENVLRQLCTDDKGHCYGTAIAPPLIRTELIREIRALAKEKFAAPIAEILALTPQPFFQAIFDLACPSMVFGSVALLGDAAYVARPHVGMGVTKAALDALQLAQRLEISHDIASALAAYNDTQSRFGHAAVQWARHLGQHLEDQLKPPEARNPQIRVQQPEVVLRQTGARITEIPGLANVIDLPRSSGRVPTWVAAGGL